MLPETERVLDGEDVPMPTKPNGPDVAVEIEKTGVLEVEVAME